MKKKNSTEETLEAVRRNTAYGHSRTFSLIYCVLLVGVIGLLVFVGTHDQPFTHRMAWLFGGILAGVAASACLYHFLFAHYDQADALLQVAKFQQRSIRSRNDALALVEKIREEVNEEEDDENLSDDQKDETSGDPTPEPAPPPVNPKPLAPIAQAPESKPKPAAIPPSPPKEQPAGEKGEREPPGD
jgi:outer membrane biosynthesis protein TonB